MLFFIIIIIAIIVYVSKTTSSTSSNTNRSDSSSSRSDSNEVSYRSRLPMYQNAIEQNRYHSISKIAHDYHLPAHLVLKDIVSLQKEGYFANIEVEYNKDEIMYFDVIKRERADNASVVEVQRKQQIQSGQSAAYAKTHRNRQPEVTEVDNKIPVTKKTEYKVKEEKQDRRMHQAAQVYRKQTPDTGKLTEDLPEYMADYGDGEVNYNFIAEYPDLSHIWDDINFEIELNQQQKGTFTCPKCNTENILVRDASGHYNCYYCQEAFM